MRREKRRTSRICALLILSTLLAFYVPPRAAAALPAADPLIRIGLFAGGNALIAANLQNYAGSGYEFGYMEGGEFRVVGATRQTKITMVKNRNLYLDNAANYRDAAFDGATVVGAFHEEIAAFDSYEEAAEKVTVLRDGGNPAFVSYTDGKWHVRSGNFADSGGGVRVSGSKYCVSVVITGTNDIIFQFDGGEGRWLAVRGVAEEGVKPITWFKGYRYYGVFEYRRMDGNNITVVNTVGMQDYIKGVIPYEMNAAWPAEALKAQTLCAKSFAVVNRGKHTAGGYDLCNTTCCQVYQGTAAATADSDRAVDETFGYYITYNGSVCNTVYHSSNGGATENSENVWYNSVPYLRGVNDTYEDLSKALHGNWHYEYTNSTLTKLLTERGYPNAGVINFYVEKYTDMGNVYTVTFVDAQGKKYSFSKESARTMLNSPSLGVATFSMRYTVSTGGTYLAALSGSGGSGTITDVGGAYAVGADGVPVQLPPAGSVKILSAGGLSDVPVAVSTTGVYAVDGKGWGHNVGMSQWGARGMAERGFTFDQILRHYFTGVEITNVAPNG